MVKQVMFVMPLNGALYRYQDFENLFDFYPGGVKSLVIEYLSMYTIPVGSSCWDNSIGCDGGTGTMEDEMLEKVMGRYEASWNYRSKQLAYPNCQTEFTIEAVCNDISQRIHAAVKEQGMMFRCFEPGFNPQEVTFLGDAAALKVMVRVPMRY